MNALPSITHDSLLAHVANDIGMLDLLVSERGLDQISSNIDLDERVTGVSIAYIGETSLATIPVGTIGTFGSNTSDPLVAEITGSGMIFERDLYLDVLIEMSIEVSVSDGVKGVVVRVVRVALILHQTIYTQIVVDAVLIISIAISKVEGSLPCT